MSLLTDQDKRLGWWEEGDTAFWNEMYGVWITVSPKYGVRLTVSASSYAPEGRQMSHSDTVSLKFMLNRALRIKSRITGGDD